MGILQFIQLVFLNFFIQALELFLNHSEKYVILISGQKGLNDMPSHKQLIKEFCLEFILVLKIPSIKFIVLFLFPEQFLLKVIQQEPTLTNQHLAVLDSQNERKYLHVFGQMNVRKIGFQNDRNVGKLESNVLFKVLVYDVKLTVVL